MKIRIFERMAVLSIETMLALAALISIFATIGVLYMLTTKTWDFFQTIPLSSFFLDTKWTPLFETKHFGIWSLVVGSLLVTFVAMITAAPLGILSAIYLSEFASSRIRRMAKPLLELLAGIPTVVYGYFALTIVTPSLMKIIPNLSGFNALSPGIVMGFMLVPTISSLCEDALYKTPRDLKEAALSLGARKVSTIFLVVLPYARSTIVAALFLAFARAIGETMIVAIAAGLKPNLTFDVREPIQTMTAYIVQVSMGDTPQQSIEYLTIFAVGAMLFLLTFIFHSTSKLILSSRFSVAPK
jgi:phosphate transport system permease protein